jgi:DNA invertase Pin-like site-specific DNA recombinase
VEIMASRSRLTRPLGFEMSEPTAFPEIKKLLEQILDRVISMRQGIPKYMTETHPDSRRLGYVRVSTAGQILEAQLEQLRAEGCARIFREQVSGARADRRELLRMLKSLSPGDVVTVTHIDRLARSTFHLFAIVRQIVDAGAQFRSLAEPWADTSTSTGRLMIAVLGRLADVERDLIRTRTTEGHSRAKARGQHMGRKPKLTAQQQAEARR